MMFMAAGVLLVCLAFHIAWIGKRAEAKGRSAMLWAVIGVVLAGLGVKVGLGLFERAEALDTGPLTFLYLTSPITLSIGPLILVVLLLMVLPVRVAGGHRWPVSNARDGAGTLSIDGDTVELQFPARSERIPRTALKATVDQESLRLAWPEHELLVMPAGKPANREGRIRQAEAIVARLRMQ
jgi:hypothetical protein